MTAHTTSSVTDGPQDSARTMIELLKQQCSLFQQLETFSRQQAALIDDGATDALLKILTQRQQVVGELSRLNSSFEPYRRDWSDLYGRLDPQEQRIAAELLERVQKLLAMVIEQDDSDRDRLRAQRGEIGNQLETNVRVGAAIAAYANRPLAVDPRFTNRQG